MTGAGQFVEFGRWDEAHRALVARMIAAENDLHSLRGAESEHRALADRIAALEHESEQRQEGQDVRRNRAWLIVLAVMSGLVCPVVVTAVVTWLHLRAVK